MWLPSLTPNLKFTACISGHISHPLVKCYCEQTDSWDYSYIKVLYCSSILSIQCTHMFSNKHAVATIRRWIYRRELQKPASRKCRRHLLLKLPVFWIKCRISLEKQHPDRVASSLLQVFLYSINMQQIFPDHMHNMFSAFSGGITGCFAIIMHSYFARS